MGNSLTEGVVADLGVAVDVYVGVSMGVAVGVGCGVCGELEQLAAMRVIANMKNRQTARSK